MKNNSTTTIVSIIGIIVLAGTVAYFGGTNSESSSRPATGATNDPHNHSAPANVSSALLDSLMNKPAPDFSLTDRDGKTYSSDNVRGKNVILFFNEGLMCYPACWNQIVALANDERLKDDSTVVLSVVVNSKEDWQEAIDKMPELGKATVVFDNNASVSKKFGVLSTSSSMHPGSLPGHTFVIIDTEGVVRYVLDDPQMGMRNDELTAEVSKLLKGNTK